MVEETAKKVWIPEVSKERIVELGERIKPVVRFTRSWRGLSRSAEGHLRYIKSHDLFNIAYTWAPKAAKATRGLKKLCDITTNHGFGYQGLFKPSIAEVLAQIPAEYLDKVVAFEIIKHPETVDDLNREHEALNAGYHVATTRLYVRE